MTEARTVWEESATLVQCSVSAGYMASSLVNLMVTSTGCTINQVVSPEEPYRPDNTLGARGTNYNILLGADTF